MSTKQKGILFLTFFGIYAFYFFLSTGINTSNDGAHVGLAKALYYDDDVEVKKYLDVYVKEPDYAVKDGKVYSDRLPGTAALILPFFAYADALSSLGFETSNTVHELDIVIGSLMPAIFGVLSAFLLFWYYYRTLKRSFRLSLLCTIIYSFGTLALLESTHLFSHAPSLFFVSLAVLISISDSITKWQSKLVMVAILLGFASLIELQNFLFFGPILIYILHKNNVFNLRSVSRFMKPVGISFLLLGTFLFLLAYYNYSTFDDFTLKSNKYNPFFPEESSFFSALSGNFFEGLDRLFTSFTNLRSYYDPRIARLNDIPGVFVTSPVMIISAFGFFFYRKTHRTEFWLLLSCILISVTIAALHVTTLVRHIYTINLIMFIPFIFTVEYVFTKWTSFKRQLAFSLILILILISVLRCFHSSVNYWGRNLDNIFSYAQEWLLFIIANLPILIMTSILLIKNTSKKSF